VSPDENARLSLVVKVTVAMVGLVVLLGLVAVSGFLGAKFAMESMATTTSTGAPVPPSSTTTTTIHTKTFTALETTSTTNAEPDRWRDLTNAEKAWCMRDNDTIFAFMRAVETLGFFEFSVNLHDFREGKRAAVKGLEADWERWEEEQGVTEKSRQMAVACRAAYEGSSADR